MKVLDLIEELQKYPKDMPVYFLEEREDWDEPSRDELTLVNIRPDFIDPILDEDGEIDEEESEIANEPKGLMIKLKSDRC